MEIRSTEETKEQILEFVNTILGLQLQKKAIDAEIKEVKQDYKENGLAVGTISKVISQVKSSLKQSESDKAEEDILREYIETSDKSMNFLRDL